MLKSCAILPQIDADLRNYAGSPSGVLVEPGRDDLFEGLDQIPNHLLQAHGVGRQTVEVVAHAYLMSQRLFCVYIEFRFFPKMRGRFPRVDARALRQAIAPSCPGRHLRA